MRAFVAVLAACVAGACTFDESGVAWPEDDPDAPSPDDPPVDDPGDDPGTPLFLYGSSGWELHRVNTATDAIETVGEFTDDDDTLTIAELASSADGILYGVESDELFTIDPATAEVSSLAVLSTAQSFRGLAFVPPGVVGDTEALIATTSVGEIYRIDPVDGGVELLGDAQALTTGDITWVPGAGLLATVTVSNGGGPGNDTDWVYHIDLDTLEATPIGDTGAREIAGLSYAEGSLWGFLGAGDVVRIDRASGAILDSRDATMRWRDAAGAFGM